MAAAQSERVGALSGERWRAEEASHRGGDGVRRVDRIGRGRGGGSLKIRAGFAESEARRECRTRIAHDGAEQFAARVEQAEQVGTERREIASGAHCRTGLELVRARFELRR